MAKSEQLQVNQEQLVEAWQRTMPDMIQDGDRCVVMKDEADERAIRVTIHCAGHQMYEMDFKITYVDSREVAVELVDVEKNEISVDERTAIIQQLIHDYTRHIHECAQALKQLTSV